MLFYLKKVLYLVLLLMLSVTTAHAELRDTVSPSIIINLPSRMLELYSGNTLIKEYPVAIGKQSTPTPVGQFNIIYKEKNPTWIPPGRDYTVESGPDNPLGYRWMGFFELYGVHGTNEPGSIGHVASNGCVRMKEENVEELFDVVKIGTPVKITYDRVKVEIDSKGQATLGIYPDVYGRKVVTVGDVNDKLAEVGLRGLASDPAVLQIIQDEADRQIPFANVYNIKVNGKLLVERGLTIGGTHYVPACPVAQALKSNIRWDQKAQLIWKDNHKTNCILKGDILYIKEDGIKDLFYGETVFDSSKNFLEINALQTTINDKILDENLEVMDGILALPVLPLANALGQVVTYDAVNHVLLLQGQKIPIGMIGDRPYIQITKINEYLKAYVYLDEQKHVVEITYPAE